MSSIIVFYTSIIFRDHIGYVYLHIELKCTFNIFNYIRKEFNINMKF
jgi:hypothetical protein